MEFDNHFQILSVGTYDSNGVVNITLFDVWTTPKVLFLTTLTQYVSSGGHISYADMNHNIHVLAIANTTGHAPICVH